MACCPAHDDRHPSLSIRELDDGRLLLHCFSGCDVKSVLSALGLEFDALFPDKPRDHRVGAERRPFLPSDVFEIVRHEVTTVAIIASRMHAARALSEADYYRLYTATVRLDDIGEHAYGR
jgi:hypothetical protein